MPSHHVLFDPLKAGTALAHRLTLGGAVLAGEACWQAEPVLWHLCPVFATRVCMNEGAGPAAGCGLGGSLLLLGMLLLSVCAILYDGALLYVGLLYNCCANQAVARFWGRGAYSLSVPGACARLHDERHLQTDCQVVDLRQGMAGD